MLAKGLHGAVSAHQFFGLAIITDPMGFGTHAISAIYSGDSTFADSGASLEQTISS
jgi:hypothetical protein